MITGYLSIYHSLTIVWSIQWFYIYLVYFRRVGSNALQHQLHSRAHMRWGSWSLHTLEVRRSGRYGTVPVCEYVPTFSITQRRKGSNRSHLLLLLRQLYSSSAKVLYFDSFKPVVSFPFIVLHSSESISLLKQYLSVLWTPGNLHTSLPSENPH